MVTIIKEAHTEVLEETYLEYIYREYPDAGFSFPWKNGEVQLNPCSKKITSGARSIRKRLSAWELSKERLRIEYRHWQDVSVAKSFILPEHITDAVNVRGAADGMRREDTK